MIEQPVTAIASFCRAEDVVISCSDEGQVQARIPRSGSGYDMPPVDQAH